VKTTRIHGADGSLYLERTVLLRVRGWELVLHRFHRSDTDPHPHDHSRGFWSLMLWGGYIEEFHHHDGGVEYRTVRPGMLVRRQAEDRHRILLHYQRKAVTLLFRGPEVREWYFWVSPIHRIPWREYVFHGRRV
jgi:hypothetical protein